MGKGVLDPVAVRGEILQLVDGVVEAHSGGFSGWPHNGLREQNASLAHLRQERLDAGTGLEQDHQRERVTAKIEVRNPLSHAIVGNLKIARLQVVNHFAAAIAHRHRRVYQRNLHFDFGLRVLGRQLDFDAGFGRDGAGGSLRAAGNGSKSCKKRQSEGSGSGSDHADFLVRRDLAWA